MTERGYSKPCILKVKKKFFDKLNKKVFFTEEKDKALGQEPVKKLLPSVR